MVGRDRARPKHQDCPPRLRGGFAGSLKLPGTTEQASRMHVADQSLRFPGGRQGFLLIHGLGGTPMEMRYIAQGLARAGHTAHVPQLAGHCGSAQDLKATGWLDWYESVEQEH